MAEPVLYGPLFSTYLRSARLALEEKGVAYRVEDVNMRRLAHKRPEHLARHPFGKVPVFEHDGFTLYETAAILRYVDEAFDGPALQPETPQARARMTQVIGVIDAYAYPALVAGILLPRLRAQTIRKEPDQAALSEAMVASRTCLAALEAALDENAFFGGAAISLADLHLMPIYDYFTQTPEGDALLPETPGLSRWWSEVSRRPSLQTTKPDLG